MICLVSDSKIETTENGGAAASEDGDGLGTDTVLATPLDRRIWDVVAARRACRAPSWRGRGTEEDKDGGLGDSMTREAGITI